MADLPSQNRTLGIVAAATVVLIWATWLVVSRSGAQSNLTTYDLAALRYGVSALFALPIVLYYKPWKKISVFRMIVVSFLLGPLYILFVFNAFELAPAAHGGIFMNGALPAITLLLSALWFGAKVHRLQLLGVVMILLGACLAAADVSSLSFDGVLLGDLLFFLAAVFFSIYLVLGRWWSISTTQVLLCSSIVNAVYYMPIWYFFLPTGFSSTPDSQIWLQTAYQGLIPGLFGLVLVAYATRNIGPPATAAFMAAVPALGALLGALFLKEYPGWIGWLSLVVLTPGILLVAFSRQT